MMFTSPVVAYFVGCSWLAALCSVEAFTIAVRTYRGGASPCANGSLGDEGREVEEVVEEKEPKPLRLLLLLFLLVWQGERVCSSDAGA